MRLHLLLAVLLAALACSAYRSGNGPVPAPASSDAELLRGALVTRCRDAQPPLRARCRQAARLYGPKPRSLWWTAQGPSPQAVSLTAALRDAESRGLDPAHYDLPVAAGATTEGAGALPLAGAAWAARDVALSLAALRFVSELSVGQVKPREAGFALVPDAGAHDLLADVRALARATNVAAALDTIDPPFTSYHLLEQALARYRRLARDPGIVFPLLSGTVRAGQPFAQAAALRLRLAATGDLPEAAVQHGTAVYDRTLAAGVARFQSRHGIAPDGILGPATASALAVPLGARARQIELALERFRWLPHRFAAAPLAVNIPEQRLFAVREVEGRYQRADDLLSMRVIVGEAWQRQTPVFSSEIRTVVFWPFWDVPASIVQEEMLPALRRDPRYLERQQLDIVEAYGSESPALAPTPENLERLASDALRLRQRPGPHNALGLLKFLLPNPYQVYLHGTPAPGLFALDRRDLSHGCIRVEGPVALARYVLRDDPEWTPERIDASVAGPETQVVRLSHPVPVYVLYLTAVPRADGGVRFYPDVYGLDAKLLELLAALPDAG